MLFRSLRPVNPNIHQLLRCAILLGKPFSEWLHDRLNRKWEKHTQPHNFFWALKQLMSRLDNTDARLVAARIPPSARFSRDDKTTISAAELLNQPELASTLLSQACIKVFDGASEYRTIARQLDILVYGLSLQNRTELAHFLRKNIGDRLPGDVATNDIPEEG